MTSNNEPSIEPWGTPLVTKTTFHLHPLTSSMKPIFNPFSYYSLDLLCSDLPKQPTMHNLVLPAFAQILTLSVIIRNENCSFHTIHVVNSDRFSWPSAMLNSAPPESGRAVVAVSHETGIGIGDYLGRVRAHPNHGASCNNLQVRTGDSWHLNKSSLIETMILLTGRNGKLQLASLKKLEIWWKRLRTWWMRKPRNHLRLWRWWKKVS